MSLVTEKMKAKAEVFKGHENCKEKVKELLAELGLPKGLLPLDNIEECGIVKETGFVWFIRKVKKEYRFSSGKLVSYAPEVTGYVEKNKIKKINGIKSKEFGFWVSVNEVYVKEPSEKVAFKGPAGISKTMPFSEYDIEAEEVEAEGEMV